jgi:hypothetical protein
MKTREQLRNDGINLWNSRCMELIDKSEDMGTRRIERIKLLRIVRRTAYDWSRGAPCFRFR